MTGDKSGREDGESRKSVEGERENPTRSKKNVGSVLLLVLVERTTDESCAAGSVASLLQLK